MPGAPAAAALAALSVGALVVAASASSAVPPGPAPGSSAPAAVAPAVAAPAGNPGAPVVLTPVGSAVPVPVPAARARYRWPLSPVPHVLRRFAVGPAPWSPGHRGVDLATAQRQQVLAAGAGVVAFAGRIAGIAVVTIGHVDGIRTTYQPVLPSVHMGDRVSAGQPLGTVSTWPGHCAGPCLHWGALRGRTYLDPLALLGLVPPVLLPLAGPPV